MQRYATEEFTSRIRQAPAHRNRGVVGHTGPLTAMQSVLALQRSVGNHATATLMVQRCGDHACGCPPEKKAAVQSQAIQRAMLMRDEEEVAQQSDASPLDEATLIATLSPFVPALAAEDDESAVQSQVQRHSKAECDERYERCGDTCRSLPPGAKKKRALCWAGCMSAYAACLATADETLATAAIVAAIVLVAADGPLPIGDAAAAALLLAVRSRLAF